MLWEYLKQYACLRIKCELEEHVTFGRDDDVAADNYQRAALSSEPNSRRQKPFRWIETMGFAVWN